MAYKTVLEKLRILIKELEDKESAFLDKKEIIKKLKNIIK